MQTLYQSIARYAFYGMVLLVPIIFLPWTVDALEINKQTVVLLLSAIAAIAWLGDMVLAKQFSFKKSWVFLLVGLFLVAAAISSALSIAPYTSWVGSGVQEYTSFLSLLAFGVVFVVGSHFLAETKTQLTVWALSLIASAIVSVSIVFAMLGLPIVQTNFIGTPNALALYLVTMAVLGGGLWLVASNKPSVSDHVTGAAGMVVKISTILTMIGAIAVSLALDYWIFWVAMILGTGVVFVFALIRAEEFLSTSRFVLPMLLFVVSIVFLFLPSVIVNPFAIEVGPNHAATYRIAKASLNDTSLLFGSGPGTFVMDYAKFHRTDVNATQFWDVTFDRGSSHLLTMLATFGVVGTMFFFVFLVALAVQALKMLITERVHAEWKMTFVAFSGWLVLAFGLFTYTSNFTLSFLFWLLSAVLMSQTGNKIRSWEFSKNPRFALLTAFLFVVVNVALLTIMFVSISRYASELAFASAVKHNESSTDLATTVERIEAATRLNARSDIFARNLAQARLLLLAQRIQDSATNPADLGSLAEATIQEAERAVRLSPNHVINYALLGDIMTELAPIAQNADVLAIQAYREAIELAPNNPKYQSALGQTLLVRADQLSVLAGGEDEDIARSATEARDEALRLAVEAFQAAIELKPDYAIAHYHLSLAYVRQGNLSDAIERMANVAISAPNDVGVAFQLGLLYLQQGRNDLAQAQLERAVAIAPNYSNAYWYLAAVYEAEGEIDAAIDAIENVVTLNPDNEAVEARLERLKLGPEPVEDIPEPLGEGETDPVQLDGEDTIDPEAVTE